MIVWPPTRRATTVVRLMSARNVGLPRRIRDIARPRLLRLLNGRHKIAVVSAPAGYGKTTLARQFAQARSVLWHRVTAEDGEPAHLMAGLLRAGRRMSPPVGEQTEAGLATRRDFERDGAFLSSSLLREVTPTRGRRWIVLDDLHALAPDADSLIWLRRWIQRSDPRLGFIFTCRGDPPLSLERFALEGGVAQIGADHLVFDPEEQRRFAKANFAAGEPTAEWREAVRGWPARLALLALRAARPSAARGAPRSGDGREDDAGATEDARRERVFAFLAQEVFEPLPADLRWALCRASLLDSLDRDSVRALLGSPAASELERSLQRRDLFVEESPELRRFHPLFHAYLRKRLGEDPRAPAVRRRIPAVARKLTKAGEPLRAVRLLAEAGQGSAALALFDEAARSAGVSLSSNLGSLAHWLDDKLSGHALPTSPWLEYHAGRHASQARQYATGRLRLARAEEFFVAAREWTLAAQVFRSDQITALQSGRHRESLERGRALLERMPRRQKAARGSLMVQIGDLYLHLGDPDEARSWLTQAEELLRRSGLEIERAEAALRRVTVDFTAGRWDLYLAEGQKSLAVFRRAGDVGRSISLLLNLSAACIYLGREDQALSHLDEARTLLAHQPTPGLSAIEAVLRFRALSDSSNTAPAVARAMTQEQIALRETAAHGSPLASLELSVWRGVFARRRDRLTEADALLRGAVEEARRIESPAWLTLAQMEWALVFGLRGSVAPALEILQSTADMSRRLGDQKELARNYLYRARLELAREAPVWKSLRSKSLRILEREDHLVLLRKEPALARALSAAPDEMRVSLPARVVPRRDARIELGLLGGFVLAVGGQPVALHRRTAEALIALLALRAGQTSSRDAIGEALWPRQSAESIRNRLDVALSTARRGLEPAVDSRGPYRVLQSQSGLLRLDPNGIELDTKRFEESAASAQPWMRQLRRLRDDTPLSTSDLAGAHAAVAKARAAYSGPLLPEFPDAAWAESARQHFGELNRRLLLAAAEIALAQRRNEEALAPLQELVANDPLDEEACQLQFRALAAAGDRASVLRRYRAFRTRLRHELQTEPSPRTIALVRSLLA